MIRVPLAPVIIPHHIPIAPIIRAGDFKRVVTRFFLEVESDIIPIDRPNSCPVMLSTV
jgi:hypothetical protein